jgi:hypothetical protein
MATPTKVAWEAGLWMLSYLNAHREEGIIYTETPDTDPVCFVDASNKDDPADGRCQYGYHIHWGGPLIWKSSKLKHVGMNSTYNEYMALSLANKQICWLRHLMQQTGVPSNGPTQVWADNKQANTLSAEGLVTAGNMYFRTAFHNSKEMVRDGYVIVSYIDTQFNLADTMTKGLGSNKCKAFRGKLHGLEAIADEYVKPGE